MVTFIVGLMIGVVLGLIFVALADAAKNRG